VKKLCAPLLAVTLIGAPACAQWSVGANVGLLVDDNSFNNSLQISDRITELSLQTGYDWETEQSNLGLSYSCVANVFALVPSRTFLEHSAGLSYARLFGEEETTLLTVGGDYSLRDNRDEYTVYDHTQWSLHVNLRHYLSETSSLRFGYLLRSVAFVELPDFDYREHALFAQAGWTFPGRTSLIIQGDLDFKEYLSVNADTGSGLVSGSGYRGGRESASAPGVTQLIGTLKIGQGITDMTGLSLMCQYQVSLQKDSRYLTFSDGTLTDDELFDDHYGYEGPLGSVMLTQLLPADIRVRLSGTLQRRRYSDRPAYDLAGFQVDAQREDNRSVYSLSVEKSFDTLGLRLTVAYDRIVNSSNDAYYDYSNDVVAARIAFVY